MSCSFEFVEHFCGRFGFQCLQENQSRQNNFCGGQAVVFSNLQGKQIVYSCRQTQQQYQGLLFTN